MGKWGRVLVIAGAVTLLAVLACMFLRGPAVAHEPVYKGKPLSYWLRGYTRGWSGGSAPANQPTSAEAAAAINEVGTNAIPTLLRMLRAHDTPLKLKILPWASRFHLVRKDYQYASTLNVQAQTGFQELGPSASEAVPELVKILDEKVSAESECYTAITLGHIGDETAVPSLLRAATNTNDFVRNNALFALGQIHAKPAVVVPVLIKALGDPWAANRANAASSLAQFKGDAKAAVPALVALLNDPNVNSNTVTHPAGFFVNARAQVEHALQQIDPLTYRQVITNAPADPARQ